jgi:hypothetical protein
MADHTRGWLTECEQSDVNPAAALAAHRKVWGPGRIEAQIGVNVVW